MEAVDALTRLGGITGTNRLVRLSSRTRVRTAVKRGEIVRVGRNRLALPTAARGLSAARALNGYLSHLSAAAHHGWEITFPPELPQLVLPRGREVPEGLQIAVEIHRGDLPLGDRSGWATAALRTVLDCGRDLRFDVALAVADSALRHGDVTYEELNLAAAGLAGPRAEGARTVARFADGRAANPFESVLRAVAVEAGLDVIPQYATQCGDLLLHPDLADPLRGVVLEADSWTWHAEKWDHDRDCARYNAMSAAGWVVLRFTWDQVMHTPTYVLMTIRTLLEDLDRSQVTLGQAA